MAGHRRIMAVIYKGVNKCIFAVSIYNTDYILVKEENFDRALKVLASGGYTVI
ncbi:MAG: ACT domain-containing protein [Lachnospiraceae bacterium]|nr:ACT domain-containing protein [Lachnospiraceae bacterium]